jgi:chemotaxis protein methyltransferase CheR
VRFERFNLLKPFGSSAAPYDLILIRNVLIYFSMPIKREIFAKLRRVIAPHGYLVIGGSETIMGLTEEFRRTPEGVGFHVPV